MEQHRPAGHAVNPVADDAAAERLARVDADLVRAAGQRDETRPEWTPSRTASRRQCVVASRPCSIRDHPPARLGARDLGERHVDHALLLGDLARRPPRDNISRPRRVSNACWNAARALAVRANSRQPLVSVSSRCIGVGGRWKPQRARPIRDAIESPPRRGASTGSPAGLSSTIASASMKRMRSCEHAMALGPAAACGRRL